MMQRRRLFSSVDSLFGPQPTLLIRDIIGAVERVAVSDLGILITGESGTGKKWLARLLHKLSGRHEKEAMTIDCSRSSMDDIEQSLFGLERITFADNEIHRGILEKSAGGTLILDRISELPEQLQLKIVRAMEHQDFHRIGGKENIRLNIRLITTIRRAFGELQTHGELGKEIYHRMCPIMINLPPLRERRDDIPFLIEHFINETSIEGKQKPRGITADALRVCMKYHWPGNIGELQKVVFGAVRSCTGQFIERKDLPEYLYKTKIVPVSFELLMS